LAEKPGDIREDIAKALDSVGYKSVETLVKELITQSRPHKQSIKCIKCGLKQWVLVDQPAPDKIAKGLEILANQAKGRPGDAPKKERAHSIADDLTSLSDEQLAKLASE
jgi:hypothetical protein